MGRKSVDLNTFRSNDGKAIRSGRLYNSWGRLKCV